MENIISLNHKDIDKAIEAYISDHGVALDGKTIEIKFTSGRGATATNSASVKVTNKEEVQTVETTKDAEKSSNDTSEAIEEKEDPVEETEPVAETQETAIGTDEVAADTSEPDDTESLFGQD